MTQLPKMRQFKNRVALKGAYEKFKRYINEYDFVDLETVSKTIDWTATKSIDIEMIR